MLFRVLQALADVIRFGEPFSFEDDCDDDPFLGSATAASAATVVG